MRMMTHRTFIIALAEDGSIYKINTGDIVKVQTYSDGGTTGFIVGFTDKVIQINTCFECHQIREISKKNIQFIFPYKYKSDDFTKMKILRYQKEIHVEQPNKTEAINENDLVKVFPKKSNPFIGFIVEILNDSVLIDINLKHSDRQTIVDIPNDDIKDIFLWDRI